jgi:indolepyruvate ferredoxin oxidoreductase
MGSNLFLLGFAWQRGLVPVSASALEQAIELNGVAVDFNRQAFLWGRRCAVQPEPVLRLVGSAGERPEPLSLDALIADREQRLTGYQNSEYAARYRQQVERVRAADPRAVAADSITMAAARQLYRLMAYKDEYEVARLFSDGEFRRKLDSHFTGDFELRFNLAPPMLGKRDPHTGLPVKQEFGPWIMTAFGWLAHLRFLRGTAFDPFGRTAERRQERADIEEYSRLLDTLMAGLSEDNYLIALELARSAAKLRGFGHIKDRNRAELAVRKEELLREFRGEGSGEPVRLVEVG